MPEHRRSPESMRAFYDWFFRFYGLMEAGMSHSLQQVLTWLDPDNTRYSGDRILELACGSANFGLLIAPRAAAYEGRDQSGKMLERARSRWRDRIDPATAERYAQPPFRQANLLELTVPDPFRPDWIAMSFALHLFPPGQVENLMEKMLAASSKGVLIIDHEQRWNPFMALIEWFEGSWYDQYVRTDFGELARRLGAELRSTPLAGCQVLEFQKPFNPVQQNMS